MSPHQQSLNIILQQGLLPLFFHPDEKISVEVVRALYAAGIRSIEYTNRGKEALYNFKALVELKNAEMKDLQLGVGTIKDKISARLFIKAGANYIISPGFVPDVCKEVNKHHMLWIPGCMTVSEIIMAEQSGIPLVKLFPGNLLGPAFMSAIRDLFPKMHFMPTGGVDLTQENIGKWFKSGVSAVGMGSKLISKNLLDARDYRSMETLTKKTLQIVASEKNKTA